ncbi:MAG: hypothetical protein HQ518_24720 [Rhodopirellula sp.]|nr:hypothetical protein [Rhodopirellula sp.]
MSIKPVDTLLAGNPCGKSYRVEFSSLARMRAFVERWGCWPSYVNQKDGRCRLEYEWPGIRAEGEKQASVLLDPGAVRRAVRILEKLGNKVTVKWAAGRSGTVPSLATLSRIDNVDHKLLFNVAGWRRGCIETIDVEDRVNMLIAILRLFPKARIQILVKKVNEGKELVRRIRDRGFLSAFKWPPFDATHCNMPIVSTVANMAPDIFDVHIFCDSKGVTNRDCRLRVHQSISHRVYGFVNAGYAARRDNRDKVLIESLIGPMLGAQRRIPKIIDRAVCILPHRSSVRVPGNATPLERKRSLVWDNAGRNETIANLAERLTAGDDSVDEVVPYLGGEPIKCLLLTESWAHAAKLAEQLQGWDAIRFSPEAIKEILSTGAVGGRRIVHGRKIITTTAVAAAIFSNGVACYHNVVVWAGGGRRPSGCAFLNDVPAIIDIHDKGERRFEGEARNRTRSYSGRKNVRLRNGGHESPTPG